MTQPVPQVPGPPPGGGNPAPQVPGNQGPTTGPPRLTSDQQAALSPEQQNAYQIMMGILDEWNLGALGQTVYDLLVQGYSQENISFLLRDTDTYKARFAGNEARKTAGLPVLSPAEYLSVERSYRQIMSNAGVPQGFYDQQSDFNQLIGKDMSPVELQRRVDTAQQVASKLTPQTRDWFYDQYGLDFSSIDRGELVAYVLDPDRGMTAIQATLRGGSIAGQARARGVGLSRAQAEQFGMAADENSFVQQGAQFADVASRGGFLSSIYDATYDVEKAGQDVFMGDAAAAAERRALQAREKGTFAGGGQAVDTTLGQGPGGY